MPERKYFVCVHGCVWEWDKLAGLVSHFSDANKPFDRHDLVLIPKDWRCITYVGNNEYMVSTLDRLDAKNNNILHLQGCNLLCWSLIYMNMAYLALLLYLKSSCLLLRPHYLKHPCIHAL